MGLPRYQPITPPKVFTHVALPNIDATAERTELNGKRVYVVNGDTSNPLYSITTILGERDKGWVEEWRKEVGEEYANKVSKNASTIGTCIHELCEEYLLNKDVNHKTKPNVILYHRFKKLTKTLDLIDNVYFLEKSLYCKRLGVAGTVDCIAEFEGELSIIDFKTSNKLKYAAEIPNYFAQTTAYAMMFHEMYGIKVKQVVIIISIDGEDTIVYKSNIGKHIDYLLDSIKLFKASNNGNG